MQILINLFIIKVPNIKSAMKSLFLIGIPIQEWVFYLQLKQSFFFEDSNDNLAWQSTVWSLQNENLI